MNQEMKPSSSEQFSVYLHDQIVGYLHRRENFTRFVFDSDYWNLPDRPVLGLSFEDDPHARHQSNLRLPPWFSNLLPEGRLREWVAKARHTSIEREMELLLQVGHDLPGAVRVMTAEAAVSVDIAEPASHKDANKDSSTSALWSFSLAGVALKFSMLAKDDRLTIPAFGEDGDWIAKLPDKNYPRVPINELAMMTFAKNAGINTPEVRLVHRDQITGLPDELWPTGEEWAYAVKRFDRTPSRQRIHIEDFAQIRGMYPEAKYSGSFETVAALAYRQHNIDSLHEAVRRLAFNVLIGNGDAHLKNWSLIYTNQRIPSLSPAYDLVSTFLYRPANLGPETMALKFGNSRRFEDVSLSTFARLDSRLDAKGDLSDVARTLVDTALSEWPQAEDLLQQNPQMCHQIKTRLQFFAKLLCRN